MKSKQKKRLPDQAPAPVKVAQIRPKVGRTLGGGPKEFPIVGVGASAGGLEAFTQLLKNLPVDSGMAFVLVQHLDPDHPIALTRLFGTTTSMSVHEVTQGTTVKPNHVYVIPQNTSMVIERGVLKLQPRGQIPGAHRTIDFFLESLAQDQRERAIGIVLSGTATDGTQGLEMIKSEGGITFAQDESAKFDSMPRSAVAAGCVDFVLSPKGIANELEKIARHPLVTARRSGPVDGPSSQSTVPTGAEKRRGPVGNQSASADRGAEDALRKIFLSLRNQYGVDFSIYKPNTIQRRVARRMVLNHQKAVGDYVQFLKGNPKELSLLYSDVLIGVTRFFRNAEAFEALKQKVFPALLQQPRRDDPVRVWTVGCSTGQEAYSIAMAFMEFCDKIPRAPKLQIFATDLNEPSLEKARRGLYARSMVTDVSPERLRRFFVEEQGGYRICKSLRDSCVFARQNILSDPPFSRMDLISCRNMLIYLEVGSQRTILPNFHYALKPGGFLFLGASESSGAFTELFDPVDKKYKIYARKLAPSAFRPPLGKERGGKTRGLAGRAERPLPTEKGPTHTLRDFHSVLDNAQRAADRVTVNRFAPPGVLINSELQILQFRGVTSAYLEQPAGKPSFDVLTMAREWLMLPLRAAINKAKKGGKTARGENVQVTRNGRSRRVNFEVIPLKDLKERCYLILFEELEMELPGASNKPPVQQSKALGSGRKAKESPRVPELERELSETRDYVQSIQEQHEAVNEELQASNEEIQSANEELQCANEELETSKEEMETTNEELTTVSEEMAHRNTELNRLNSDLVNLQDSTQLAIVLLGRDLTIRRFSSQAKKQFNLLAADAGRPITGVRHNLDLPDLDAFISDVIVSVREREREVRDKEGRWFSLRVRPYLTLDNKVDGAVLVLVDIDELKKKEGLIAEARGHAEIIIQTVPDPLVILNADLRIHSANEAFHRTFKLTRPETEGRLIFELGHGSWDIPQLCQPLEEIIPRNSFFNDFEVIHNFEGIGRRTFLFNARSLNNAAGKPKQILLGIRDITEVLTFQAELRRSELRHRRLFEAAHDGVLLVDPESRKIIDANPSIAGLLGYTREELCGKELFEVGLFKDRTASEAAFRQFQANGRIRYEDLPLQTKAGQKREVEFISNLYTEDGGKIVQCNIRDITERKLAEHKFRILLESAPDAMIISDHEGKISLINAQAETMFGYGREELVGQPVEVLVPQRFKENHPGHRHHFLESPRPRQMGAGQPLSGLRKDGTEFPVEISLSPVETGNGILVIAAVRDISEREKSEEALRRSEERYRTLFTSIDEGFCVISMLFDENLKPVDFTFVEVNPSFEKHTGIRGAPGKRMREIVPDLESYWFESYGKVAQTGEPVRFVQEATALSSWFDVYAFRLGNQESRRVAIIFNNITERKMSEDALRRARAKLAARTGELEQAVTERTADLAAKNKQLEAFVYSIAHDLRAPLRSMQGFSDLLVEEVGATLSQTGRDFAHRISASAQFLDSLLQDLIAFGEIAEQRIELGSMSLESVVQMAIDSLEREIQEKGALVEVVGPWPNVLAHEPTLALVLVQLVVNALKFVAPNVRPVVRLRAEKRGEFVRVSVGDNGIGIAPAYQEQIFDLFTRLHGEKYGGTGIGLALVKKGIERLGGQAGVESTPGQGSKFWFELRKA